MIRVVLLEPDYWHRRGVAGALEASEDIELADGDVEAADVVLLSHASIEERGVEEIVRAAERYAAAVLVYGEERDAEVTAAMLIGGARGYHAAGDPPLAEAVRVVASGAVWGARAALALLAERVRNELPRSEQRPEIEILQLLNDGLTNKEIGQHLGLAESTIKSRMNRLYKRFGVTTRLQLLSAALRKGLVPIRSGRAGERK